MKSLNPSYLVIIIQTVIAFFVLLALTRFLGKKQLSHLTFFNYVTGITIGSIAANMVVLTTSQYKKYLISLIVWCALTFIISYISLKSGKIRVILDGQPTIIIKKGKIDKKALSRTHVNIDDLTMMIRQYQVFSITEIDYAILEPNGRLSILKKPEFQGTQKSDMQILPASPAFIPTEIITDGKLLEQNLLEVGKSKEWLNNELKKANIKAIEDVFYAEIQPDGKMFIQKN
ncbi:YetF domain-containing protein [Lysinibacillus sp. NPDC097231]|uniref:YetF domain-containing protein n=1 Tax=Lysinibacillus sp. NPDC097231 TaxID=3364142 RepID=UPI00382DAA11